MKLFHFLFFAVLYSGAAALAYEEPLYETLRQMDDYEIRKYESYIVAETVVDGDFDSTGGDAFRILASYIFGDNDGGTKMEMTTPVTRNEDKRDGTKMNMTVPVTRAKQGEGANERFAYQFVMERKYTLDTLPLPIDPRVGIKSVPERVVAVRRYSGGSNERNFQKNLALLKASLERDKIETIGEPISAAYNSPFVPGPFRRNEVMVEVRSDQF